MYTLWAEVVWSLLKEEHKSSEENEGNNVLRAPPALRFCWSSPSIFRRFSIDIKRHIYIYIYPYLSLYISGSPACRANSVLILRLEFCLRFRVRSFSSSFLGAE